MEINIARLNRLGNLGAALDRLERLTIAIGTTRAIAIRHARLQRAYSRASLSRTYLGVK